MRSEQDSVWKEVLDAYFKEFLEFFFPDIHAEIDWNRKYEFLDKELEKISRRSDLGRRLVDKLVKVYLPDGEESWVLIHIEVQGKEESDFAERMFTYYYRILDRYKREVSSLAVLTDPNPNYKPDAHHKKRFRTELDFSYPIAKILDYNSKWAELEANPNPFAVIVMAQLKYLELKKQADKLAWKLRLVRMLYQRGYSRKDVIQLFRLIDWLIKLPDELEETFWEEVEKEEEQGMPYVTSVERIGEKRGMLALIVKRMKRKFGEIEPELEQQLEKLSTEQLDTLDDVIADFSAVAQVKDWLEKNGSTKK